MLKKKNIVLTFSLLKILKQLKIFFHKVFFISISSETNNFDFSKSMVIIPGKSILISKRPILFSSAFEDDKIEICGIVSFGILPSIFLYFRKYIFIIE